MRRFLYALCTVILMGTLPSPAADPFLVLRVSTPLVASAAAGLRFGSHQDVLKPTIQAEAGIGGGKIAIGLDSTGIDDFGYAIKAALIRTWIEPLDVDEDQSFLGLEGEVSLHRLILNIGGYRRVGEGKDDWLLSAGLGFFF